MGKNAARIGIHARARAWTPVPLREMKAFLAVFFNVVQYDR